MEEHKENQPSIFEELKSAREEKGLSLQDIAQRTHIRLDFLQALEEGNLGKIPHVYDKLFFQTYLRVLGIEDEEKYIKAYRELRKELQPQYTTTIGKLTSVNTSPGRMHWIKILYIAIPALILALIIILLAINSSTITPVDHVAVNAITPREIVKNIQKNRALRALAADTIKENSKTVTLTNRNSDVKVELKALDKTWVRVVRDRADTLEYLLQKGNEITIKGDSLLNFILGNAGGVRVTVNNRDEGILGKPYQVVTRLVVNQKGIIQKLIKDVGKNHVKVDSLQL